MTQITCKLLILKVTAAEYTVVLLPIFQTVRCQILEVYNIDNIAEWKPNLIISAKRISSNQEGQAT